MKTMTLRLLLAGCCLLATTVSATVPYQPPFDPKRKKPGEECKSNDECQRHHKCEIKDDKAVCTAPPPPKLPPGVVT
ncbi:MAG: hypothetical protein OHK0011_20440 [Turneriella sp.]